MEAGADLVLVSHTYEEQWRRLRALVVAVRSGRIPESQIDESSIAVGSKGEAQHGRPCRSDPQFAALFGSDASKARRRPHLREQYYAPTKMMAEPFLCARRADARYLAGSAVQRTEVDEPIEQSYTLATALSPYVDHVEEWRIGTYPEAEEVEATLEKAASFKQIVVLTYNAVSTLHPGQVEIVQGLMGARCAVIVASTRNPYDLNQFPKRRSICAATRIAQRR